jgi:hypothetical protein
MRKKKKSPNKPQIKNPLLRIMEATLQAQEFALRRALELEGLPFNESTLRRVVRVKYAVPPEVLPVSRKYPLPETKLPIFDPIVQGTFILDQGQPTEKVLFYFQMPSIKDPLFRVWYPGEIEVTVNPNAETSVGMVPDYEGQKRNLKVVDAVITVAEKIAEIKTGFPPGGISVADREALLSGEWRVDQEEKIVNPKK